MSHPRADQMIPIREITLTKLPFVGRFFIAEHLLRNMEVRSYVDERLQAMVVMVNRNVMSKKIGHEHVQWPADWWEALKDRFAPKWFKTRYPVDYAKLNLDIYATFPEVEWQDKLGPCLIRSVGSWPAVEGFYP